jgi:hypothetical protein
MKIQMYVQLDKENPGTGNIRGLNLAADKPTTVRVSNCRFLGLNKLRQKLLHYPALTEVPVYRRTYIRVSLCFVKMYNMHISPTLMWPRVE